MQIDFVIFCQSQRSTTFLYSLKAFHKSYPNFVDRVQCKTIGKLHVQTLVQKPIDKVVDCRIKTISWTTKRWLEGWCLTNYLANLQLSILGATRLWLSEELLFHNLIIILFQAALLYIQHDILFRQLFFPLSPIQLPSNL